VADEIMAPATESAPSVDNAPAEAPASNDAPVSVDSVEEVGAPEQTYQSQPQFDYNAFARANAESLRPIMQQFAPKPAPAAQPWDDRNKFWTLPQGPEANEAFHTRLEQVMDARLNAALDKQRQEFAQILQGRDAYFKQSFAVDPNFQRIQTHFDRYVQRGYDPADAKRLAAMDAGMNGQSAQGRSLPAAPRHLTTQAARSVGGVPPTKSLGDLKNNENLRESRFKALAAKHGWET